MLFADDMVIVGKDRNDLQRSLDLVNSYLNKWGLAVNTDKTKVVVVRNVGGCLITNRGHITVPL